MDDLVVDTHGAAVRTGLSAATLEKKRVHGDGPPFLKMGRSVRYRVADLEAWMARQLVGSTSERCAATGPISSGYVGPQVENAGVTVVPSDDC